MDDESVLGLFAILGCLVWTSLGILAFGLWWPDVWWLQVLCVVLSVLYVAFGVIWPLDYAFSRYAWMSQGLFLVGYVSFCLSLGLLVVKCIVFAQMMVI